MDTQSSAEAVYAFYGMEHMTYTHLEQTHVMSVKEYASVPSTKKRLRTRTGNGRKSITDGIPAFTYEAEKGPEPRQMLCETLLDMENRPGAVKVGVRPVQRFLPGPSQRFTLLSLREKVFINENLPDYPIAIIALAIGVNPNAVSSYAEQAKQEPRLALKRRMFGEYDAMALRKKFLMDSLQKFDDEE